MPLSINTNLFALNAQRNLNRTQAPLTTAMQRLSSTLRINSAKDDAAGLAIATRMTRQVNGLTVAMRNANDGLSISQSAEGAMDEMIYALQRMNELAEQAASYNTALDRSSMNQEVSQLIEELSRIVNQTRYNGERLLAGGFNADIQVGVEVNETININIGNLSPTTMGVASNYSDVNNYNSTQLATRIARAYSNSISNGFTIEGINHGTGFSANTNSITKIERINQYTSQSGVSAFGYGNGFVGSSFDPAGAAAEVDAGALVINGISIGAAAGGANRGASADNLVTAINAKTAEHGVVAVRVNNLNQDASDTDSAIVLINRTGAAITVTANTAVDADIATFFTAGTSSVGVGANGAIVLSDNVTDTTLSFDGTATALGIVGDNTSANVSLSATYVNSISVTTAANANMAILTLKSAMETFNAEKAILGAKLNRFESVIRNLDNVRENISAARSRIMDADFAIETSNLTKAMIMQQAGISVLAQANTLPQNVLALLQR